MGGCGLTNIASKCTALLSRMYFQSKKDGMVTAMWSKTWNLTGRLANPPNTLNFPTKLAYLHTYAFNMAYIMPPDQTETLRCFHRRIYNSLHIMTMAQQDTRGMWIETQHPAVPWPTLWRILHAVWAS
jgi:hypothetical protein